MRSLRRDYDMKARARTSDPTTSHEAAASVKELTQKQTAVLDLFRARGPMTDEQLVLAYREAEMSSDATPKQAPSGIRTRRNELVQRRLLARVAYRRTESGRRAIVWGARREETPPVQERLL
jgi:hypothetical protein